MNKEFSEKDLFLIFSVWRNYKNCRFNNSELEINIKNTYAPLKITPKKHGQNKSSIKSELN